MPAVNEIFAPLGNRMETTTATVYQYNSGMILRIIGPELPENYRVDFANSISGQSKSILGGADGVLIPYEYFTPGSYIHAWVVLTGEDYAVTRYHITIPISPRAVPTDEQPSPEQESIIDQTIAALNNGVERVEQVLDSIPEDYSELSDDVQELKNGKITTLDNTVLAQGRIVEAIGVPIYIKETSEYSAYGIAESGWYVFARVSATRSTTVSASTTVTGATGYIANIGADYIDLAIRFDTTAQSVPVEINWGTYVDSFVFKASDLAVRNLDYRVTFYIYDIARYCTWEYALTADTTFTAGKNYYTKDGDTYTLATVSAGDAVPADTYYNHSLLTISGMIKNVTYELNEAVDCGMKIILPAIEEDGHGAWFDFHFYHSASGSVELVTPAGVKKATATGSASVTAGVNAIELRYTTAKEKLWSMFNEHTNVPAS